MHDKQTNRYFQTGTSTLKPAFISFFLTIGSGNLHAVDAFNYEMIYTGELWSNRSGGLQKGEVYLDNFDFLATMDAGQVLDWDGVTAFTHVIYNNSETLTDRFVGDVQGISNIDNSTIISVMELWLEKAYSQETSLRFGLYDLNSEFDSIDTAGFFINPSHGIGPDYSQSGENGPSIFPVSSLAIRLHHQLTQDTSFRFAILDAVPGKSDNDNYSGIELNSEEGALIAAEVNHQFAQTRVGLGNWYYTQESTQVDGLKKKNSQGVYGFADHEFAQTHWLPGQLRGFVRVGFADSKVNRISRYVGTGMVLGSFIQSRPDDTLGLAIASARNGDSYQTESRLNGFISDSSETNYELSYHSILNDLISVQADVQYIVDPGSDPDVSNDLIFGLRLSLTLH